MNDIFTSTDITDADRDRLADEMAYYYGRDAASKALITEKLIDPFPLITRIKLKAAFGALSYFTKRKAKQVRPRYTVEDVVAELARRSTSSKLSS